MNNKKKNEKYLRNLKYTICRICILVCYIGFIKSLKFYLNFMFNQPGFFEF